MLGVSRVRRLLAQGAQARVLVVGDVMLDQFLWGRVSRISPEAPVPVVDLERESLMPGGAANVARNLAALGVPATLVGVVGRDDAAGPLRRLLQEQGVDCGGLLASAGRMTTRKVRIVAHQQQVARVDRETRGDVDPALTRRLLAAVDRGLPGAAAVIVGDYGKGVVTQPLLDGLKERCRRHGVWLSLDPKPVHRLDLAGLSLITPNRKEVFELAGVADTAAVASPMDDAGLREAVRRLLTTLEPALLLVTLGEQGMFLCRQDEPPHHIPTMAREVFDVSGAGDTVIATFTLAIAAGASPLEAAILSNHAAGVVVGKVGTAVVSPEELLASFRP